MTESETDAALGGVLCTLWSCDDCYDGDSIELKGMRCQPGLRLVRGVLVIGRSYGSQATPSPSRSSLVL